MGAFVDYMGGLPTWYWVVAALLGTFLVAMSFVDEFLVEESDRMFWILIDSRIVRLVVKVLMSLTFALFWLPLSVPLAAGLGIFIVLICVFFVPDFWREMTKSKPDNPNDPSKRIYYGIYGPK